MGTTYHAHGAQRMADAWATEGNGHRMAFADRWRRDPRNQNLCAVYGDPFRGWDQAQLAALWFLIMAGRASKFAVTYVSVGTEPHADRYYADNRQALSRLPDGITAEVYQEPSGGAGIPDGTLTVSPDAVVFDDEDPHLERDATPWSAMPLEIGRTDASRTLVHLMEDGAVARWPYGLDRLYTLVTTPRLSLTLGFGLPGFDDEEGDDCVG